MKFSRVLLLALVFVVLSVSVSFGVTQEEFSAKLEKAQRGDAHALEWFEKAAAQGLVPAQLALGMLYYNGYGVKQDYKKARELFEKSAKQGNALGQYLLGVMYTEGRGVRQDYKKARELIEKAAKQGNAYAQAGLGFLYYHGYGVKQDYKKARELFEKSAKQGNTNGQVWLGLMYAGGLGVKQDEKKAVELIEKAAKQGNAYAQVALGFLYYNGYGVKQDHKMAVDWLKKSAAQNFGPAYRILGEINEDGKGVKLDSQEAFRLYTKGAELGDADSMMALGRMYENGTGTNRDMTKAIDFYYKAAAGGNEQAKKALARLLNITTSAPQKPSDFRADSRPAEQPTPPSQSQTITTPTPQKPSDFRADSRPAEQPTTPVQSQTIELFAGNNLFDRPRVAVYAFEDKTEEGKAPAHAVSDMLVSELFKAGVFRLIERERLDTIAAEIKRAQSGMLDPATAAKAGRIAGAQYIILGSVTLYRYSEKASGFVIPILGSSSKAKTAYVVLDLRIIDVETSEIVYAYDKEGEATNRNKKSPGSSSKMIDGLLGMATRNAVEKHVAAMKIMNLQ